VGRAVSGVADLLHQRQAHARADHPDSSEQAASTENAQPKRQEQSHVSAGHIWRHTLELAGAGMMTTQAVAAAGNGVPATRLPAGTGMAIAGVTSIRASMILIPYLRRPRGTPPG
jgi:hypothetical protein